MEKSESTAMEEGQKTTYSSSSQTTAKKMSTYSVTSTLSNLPKLLPTGVLFIFMSFSNLIASDKTCGKWNKILVASFLGILAVASFILQLTDTFKEESESTGKVHVRYGIVTKTGFKSLTRSKSIEAKVNLRMRMNISLIKWMYCTQVWQLWFLLHWLLQTKM